VLTESSSTTFPIDVIVPYITTARQRLGKHIQAEENPRDNRMSIARQRISKHTSRTTGVVLSAWSVQNGYKLLFSNKVVAEKRPGVELRRQPTGI
jgi:hypothetical protein